MSSQYIPAEFKGLAREFRRQVDAGDEAYTSAVNRIKRTLHARLVRKPTLRAGMVIDIEREFRALANPYRLRLNIDTSNRGRHLQITDIVIGSSKDREESWEDWEKTTAILRINISTVGGIKVSSAPVATLSGHAIARWYQRTGCRDQAKLLRDIGMILDAAEPDRVVVPSGVWLGKTVNAFT